MAKKAGGTILQFSRKQAGNPDRYITVTKQKPVQAPKKK